MAFMHVPMFINDDPYAIVRAFVPNPLVQCSHCRQLCRELVDFCIVVRVFLFSLSLVVILQLLWMNPFLAFLRLRWRGELFSFPSSFEPSLPLEREGSRGGSRGLEPSFESCFASILSFSSWICSFMALCLCSRSSKR
jgi:hypothetical protein